MSRRDDLKTMLSGTLTPTASPTSPPTPVRVADRADPTSSADRRGTGVVRAMGLSLKSLQTDAQTARDMKEALLNGNTVVELDPALIDDSFISDRLLNGDDPAFEEFKDGIKTHGQKVPILVRPHPNNPDRYEIAYGRRRRRACLALGRKVRAVITPLSDEELVIAQGKENNDREDPSFIERAIFAKAMEERNFDRSVIMAALSVQKAELSRLLSIANSISTDVIIAIGPARKAGRKRWTAFAERLKKSSDASDRVATLTGQADFKAADSDRRFTLLYDALQTKLPTSNESWRNSQNHTVVRIEHTRTATKLAIDEVVAPTFGKFLIGRLEALYREFEAEVAAKSE